ncbi:hypothetical protein ONZ43_g5324 [Nemania bipapillata]|uniref:Uncharacterized protein n=1 Tax=Nemania bipapillata TaxID=110536 RepID=A0ACC2IC21_9PEZI|nr:hypothetical protein ONZ43_g5324 [Nemania bipapillata]
MSATTMSSAPVVPPRPSRSQDKNNGATPAIPARPTKRFNRSVSPNPDRFAPSPLNDTTFSQTPKRNSQSFLGQELERTTSVDMPGVGEEGQEYAVAILICCSGMMGSVWDREVLLITIRTDYGGLEKAIGEPSIYPATVYVLVSSEE